MVSGIFLELYKGVGHISSIFSDGLYKWIPFVVLDELPPQKTLKVRSRFESAAIHYDWREFRVSLMKSCLLGLKDDDDERVKKKGKKKLSSNKLGHFFSPWQLFTQRWLS